MARESLLPAVTGNGRKSAAVGNGSAATEDVDQRG
jgi:hypothetical protein